MTANVLNNNNFILTPQQQELLYTALASNRAAANNGLSNGLTLDPTSFTQSPMQNNNGVNGLPDQSPFLDYDYSFDAADSSFDFSFDGGNDNGTTAKMIGDLPGSGSSSKEHSASPEQDSPSDSHDKRSHPDDDEDDEESDPKRRESVERQPKKPGRKPLTSEPTTKRKAQNRAAQRAFRERKERHLKDLEDKVEELEKASSSVNKENTNLRSELEKMSSELEGYKKKLALLSPNRPNQSGGSMPTGAPSNTGFGQSMVNNLTDVSFQFEFPKFGQLPGPSLNNGTTLQSPAASKSPSSERSPGAQGNKTSNSSPGYISGLDSQTKEELAKFSGLFSPPLTNNNVASMSRGSMDSHYSAGPNSTSSPSASSHSNMGATSSCGTSPEPSHQSPMGFKPVDTLTTIGEETQGDAGHFANIDVNDLSWLGAQNDFQFDPQLFGGYREPQENVLATGGFDDSFFNDAFATDFTTPYNMPTPSPLAQKKDLIAQIDAAKESDADFVTAPPAYEGVSLTCNKIWEKLQNCPKVQNGDFDLDGLCSDLQKKAKCSGSGPVVDQGEFKAVMEKYLGKNNDENCLKGLA